MVLQDLGWVAAIWCHCYIMETVYKKNKKERKLLSKSSLSQIKFRPLLPLQKQQFCYSEFPNSTYLTSYVKKTGYSYTQCWISCILFHHGRTQAGHPKPCFIQRSIRDSHKKTSWLPWKNQEHSRYLWEGFVPDLHSQEKGNKEYEWRKAEGRK